MILEDNKIVIYQTEDGQTQIDVRLENDMIWLTRQQIAALFGRDYKTISKHINNALKEELAGSVVVAKFANTTQHGAYIPVWKRRPPCCSISSRRTTRSATATSALPPHYSFGSSTTTAFSIAPMAANDCRTIPL